MVDVRLVDQVEGNPGDAVDNMLAGMDRNADIVVPGCPAAPDQSTLYSVNSGAVLQTVHSTS